MANGLLNYYNRGGGLGLLQDSSMNIARQMTPQMQFQNPLLGMDLSHRQPTFGDQFRTAATGGARGLGGLFTGEGSSARLSALGASLLAGPSRTPISFGSSMAQGLLAGNQAAAAEEERKFKRGLLEQEMDYKVKSLQAKSSKDTLYNITQIDSDGKPFTFTVDQDGASKYYNDPNSTITKVGSGSETGNTPTVLTSAAQNVKSQLGELSNDTVVNPDGTVTVIQGSKTQQDLQLKADNLTFDKQELELRLRQLEIENSFEERKIALREGTALQNDNKAKLDYDIAIYNFEKDQEIEKRKKSSAWDAAFDASLKIKDVKKSITQYGVENVTGPMSVIGGIPVFGTSQPQGQVDADLQTLKSQLTKIAMDKFREGSDVGATGFGALNAAELNVIEKLMTNLDQYQDGKQLLRNLDRLEKTMDALMYGVIVDGKYKDYVPTEHRGKLYENKILPATPNNQKMIGVPTEKQYPALKGSIYLGRTVNGDFKFNVLQDGKYVTKVLGE